MTDVIIVGGGMSGMTACLYVLRGGKTATIFEGESIGGQIAGSPRVENFPSRKRITGEELATATFEQITSLGAEFIPDKIVKVEKQGKIFKVITEYGDEYTAKSVILATGVKHRTLSLEGEEELVGNGVYYCAVCDGAFFEGKDVAVIGDANSAFQYALYLSEMCKSVTVVALFDKLFADKWLIEAVKSRDNIKVLMNTQTIGYEVNGKFEGLNAIDKNSGEKVFIPCDGVFIAIGQKPVNDSFSNVVDIDKDGYFASDESCQTKTEGLFVAGDARAKKIRQLTTACSDGAVSASMACSYIDKNF